jgi:hypothetical protein
MTTVKVDRRIDIAMPYVSAVCTKVPSQWAFNMIRFGDGYLVCYYDECLPTLCRAIVACRTSPDLMFA